MASSRHRGFLIAAGTAGIATGLFVAAPAHAQSIPSYASDPAELLFTDTLDVFEDLEVDTGAMPSGSIVAVRFAILSNGSYDAELEGTSELWWPDPLTHQITGVPQGGWLGLTTDISIGAYVILDLDSIGLGVQTIPVWTDGLFLRKERGFSGLLLADSPVSEVEVSSDGQVIGPFEYSQTVFTGVDLVFRAHATPRATATLSGVRIETTDADENQVVYTKEADTGIFDVPADPSTLPLTSTYYGQLDASLELVVVPAVEVCITIIGCYELASFEIPIPLGGKSEERAFSPNDYDHPLPSLAPPISQHEFGEVVVDNLANLPLLLENVGLLDLEGEITLTGDPAFTVFPNYFYATPGHADGAIVTYAPTEAGTHTALLTITSNDPLRPLLEIPLLGEGVDALGSDDPDGTSDLEGDSVAVDTGFCGCAVGSSGAGAPWLGLLGLGVLTRRRRSVPGRG